MQNENSTSAVESSIYFVFTARESTSVLCSHTQGPTADGRELGTASSVFPNDNSDLEVENNRARN